MAAEAYHISVALDLKPALSHVSPQFVIQRVSNPQTHPRSLIDEVARFYRYLVDYEFLIVLLEELILQVKQVVQFLDKAVALE